LKEIIKQDIMSIFTENDMIFTSKNNKMSAGGYEVNIPFLNNNIPVSYSLNTSESMFGGLVVPSGLLYLTPDSKLTTEIETMSGGGEIPLNDKLYDKLFQLAQLGGSDTNQLVVQGDQEAVDEVTSSETTKKKTRRKRISNKRTRKL